MRRMIVAAIVISILWIPVSAAGGASTSVDSATDQYVEYIPGVTGRGDGDSDSGAKKPGASSPPPKVIKKLAQRGADGVAAAILAQSSAPPDFQSNGGTKSPKSRGQGSSGDAAGKTAAKAKQIRPKQIRQDTETSGFSAVLSNIGGSGMGIVLPILLLLAVVGVLLIRVVEARASGGEPRD